MSYLIFLVLTRYFFDYVLLLLMSESPVSVFVVLVFDCMGAGIRYALSLTGLSLYIESKERLLFFSKFDLSYIENEVKILSLILRLASGSVVVILLPVFEKFCSYFCLIIVFDFLFLEPI